MRGGGEGRGGTGATKKHPFVRREGVGTRAVVQGMGEGGGRRPKNDDP